MSDIKNIKTALISVYHKDGLDEILSLLHNDGVKFLSTGGTQTFIESLGYPCNAVEDLTGYPSILGGRVKTLHPKVFGGILNRREHEGDKAQIAQYEIPEIDLVIVDLYPFVDTVASGASNADIIEKIDIGGISLIRAAAKNYNDVIIVASKGQYSPRRNAPPQRRQVVARRTPLVCQRGIRRKLGLRQLDIQLFRPRRRPLSSACGHRRSQDNALRRESPSERILLRRFRKNVHPAPWQGDFLQQPPRHRRGRDPHQ